MDDTGTADEKPQKCLIKFIHSYAKKKKVDCKFVVNCDKENETFTAKLILAGETFSAKGKTKKEAKNNAAYLAMKKIKIKNKCTDSVINFKTVMEEPTRIHHFNKRKKHVSRKKRQSNENGDRDPEHLLINQENADSTGQPVALSEATEEIVGKQHSEHVEESKDASSQNELESLKNQDVVSQTTQSSQLILPDITNLAKKKRHSSVKGKSIKGHDANKKTCKKKSLGKRDRIILPNVLDTSEGKKDKKTKRKKTKIVNSSTQIQSVALGEDKAVSLPNIINAADETVSCKETASSPNQTEMEKAADECLLPTNKGESVKKKKRSKKGESVILIGNNLPTEGKIVSQVVITRKKKKGKNKSEINVGSKAEGSKCNTEEAIGEQLSKNPQVDPGEPDGANKEPGSLSSKRRNLKPLIFNKIPSKDRTKEQQNVHAFHTDLTSLNQVQDGCNKLSEDGNTAGNSLLSPDGKKASLPSSESRKVVKTERCGKENEKVTKRKTRMKKNKK